MWQRHDGKNAAIKQTFPSVNAFSKASANTCDARVDELVAQVRREIGTCILFAANGTLLFVCSLIFSP
jgi:hypothetical protein